VADTDILEALTKADASLSSDAPDVETTPTETVTTADVAPVEEPAETQGQADQRARDEAGKFTKAPKAKAAKAEKPAAAAPRGGVHGAASAAPSAGQVPADGAVPPPAPSAEAATPVVKTPQSWTPAAREAFAKAPPEVQAEVTRREREIARTLSETAEARKVAQSVHQTLAPFEGLARSQGMDSMQYAGSVLQTAAALHMGTPQQKAAVVAQIIGSYGVDLDAINAELQGQPAQAQHAPPVNVDELVERRFQAIEAKRAQESNLRTAQEFLDSSPEFLSDVLPDMQELLRIDRFKGGNMTPQQAYDRACKLNEGVQSVLAQRKAAESARTAQASTARTQAAASSVRSTPAAAPERSAQPKSIEEALKAADAALSGRV
jgi:hypothetical protein